MFLSYSPGDIDPHQNLPVVFCLFFKICFFVLPTRPGRLSNLSRFVHNNEFTLETGKYYYNIHWFVCQLSIYI